MTTTLSPPDTAVVTPPKRRLPSWAPSGSELLFVLLVLAFLLRPLLTRLTNVPAVQTWSTIFVAIALQAMPFLVLGTLISGAIAAFVPPSFFRRALPKRPALAVPVAGLAGVLLPGCECGSVPVAGGLMARGVTPGAALAFLLSAPAINPIVLVSTAVAFPGHPEFVLARLSASLLAAVVVGLLWVRFGKQGWITPRRLHEHTGVNRWSEFGATVRHDFLQAGGFLELGALLAATLNVVVPRSIYTAVAGDPVLAVVALRGWRSCCRSAPRPTPSSPPRSRSSPRPPSWPSSSSGRWSTSSSSPCRSAPSGDPSPSASRP